ncbi:hypothetical protein ACFQFR_32815 [Streptomyces goshikiensis]
MTAARTASTVSSDGAPGAKPAAVSRAGGLTRAGQQRRVGEQPLGVPGPGARQVDPLDGDAGRGGEVDAARGRTEGEERRARPGELT